MGLPFIMRWKAGMLVSQLWPLEEADDPGKQSKDMEGIWGSEASPGTVPTCQLEVLTLGLLCKKQTPILFKPLYCWCHCIAVEKVQN